jgi:hypothetical protein
MGHLTWCALSLIDSASNHKVWITFRLVTLWTVIRLPQKLGQSWPQHLLRLIFILWKIGRLLTHGDDSASVVVVPLLITLVIRFIYNTLRLVLRMIKEVLHRGSLVLLGLFLTSLIEHRVVALLSWLSRVVDRNRLCIETLGSLFKLLILLLGIIPRILVKV